MRISHRLFHCIYGLSSAIRATDQTSRDLRGPAGEMVGQEYTGRRGRLYAEYAVLARPMDHKNGENYSSERVCIHAGGSLDEDARFMLTADMMQDGPTLDLSIELPGRLRELFSFRPVKESP